MCAANVTEQKPELNCILDMVDTFTNSNRVGISPLTLQKYTQNQVLVDFGRGSSVDSEIE